MPAERVAMRHVREIVRLTLGSGLSGREISRRLGVAPSTVRETVRRFQAASLVWPLAEELSEEALEQRLYGAAGSKQGHRRHVEPDWAAIHRELKRKHVTLSIRIRPIAAALRISCGCESCDYS